VPWAFRPRAWLGSANTQAFAASPKTCAREPSAATAGPSIARCSSRPTAPMPNADAMLTLDLSADPLHACFSQEPVTRAEAMFDRVVVDYDAGGEVRGIVVLSASLRMVGIDVTRIPRHDDLAQAREKAACCRSTPELRHRRGTRVVGDRCSCRAGSAKLSRPADRAFVDARAPSPPTVPEPPASSVRLDPVGSPGSGPRSRYFSM
jgi:uncharacterized protein YuzE